MSEKYPLYSREAAREISDEVLLQGAREGDRAAEETLILRYTRMVRACARPLFLAGGDSEDLLQEGLLGLLDAVREFDSRRDAAFPTFARVCVQNRLRSAVRQRGAGKTYGTQCRRALGGAGDGRGRAGARKPGGSGDRPGGEKEELARLGRELSPFEREVLGQYLEGLSYAEIARATGRPSKAVDNAVQRIRRKLGGAKHGDISAS